MKSTKKMRMLARIISMVLAVVLVSESFLADGNIVLAANQEETEITTGTESDNLEGAVTEDGSENNSSNNEEYDTEGLDILFEVEEHRDRTSKHYRLSDGTIMAADYGMDVHYEKDGEWKDIDNRFVYEAPTAADPMEGFSTAEGNVKFKFAPDTGDGEVVRAAAGGYSVGFEFLADADAGMMQEDGTVSMEDAELSVPDGAVVSEEELEIIDMEDISETADANGSSMETAPVPITFIKGEVLNASEAAQVLNTEEIQSEPVSSYAANAVSTAADGAGDETSDAAWADTGIGEDPSDGDGEKTLMEQASLENAVTSVGYENVRPGVSLQYIASGSSLKEYILLSEKQDSYVYSFAMNLGDLEAEKQEDGSILLYDPADGAAVYEIPAAYMTDAAGAYSDAVEMELAEASDGRYILTLTADADWIDDEERVFPVQIDPTLSERLFSRQSDIRGFYVIEEQEETSTENYGWMYVGYDGSGYGYMTTYIQMKNLEKLPQDSVVCASYFNMAVVAWDECECPKLHVQAKRLNERSDWNEDEYCYKFCPDISSEVLDIQTLTQANLTDNEKRYVAWNITELVKEYYNAGNESAIIDFALESTGGMRDGYYVNAALNLTWTGAEPVLQTFYRDTKGLEDYYTYQSQSIGHAGTGYISDHSLQLTIAKNIASHNHTAMDCGIGLVYNSACSNSYFTNGGNIHTKDFQNMQAGVGWKLTLQETVVPVSVTDLESTKEYLVYNDSDGTEHYFHYNEETKKYEDEDGLNLAISKSGTDYTMTDKKDNKKVFINGYLKEIQDANGNRVIITYDSANRIESVSLDTASADAAVIYSFGFDASTNCLSWIKEHATGRKYIFTYGRILDKWRLTGISRRLNEDASTDTAEAQYSYHSTNGRLIRAYDAEKKTGIEYTYYKSDTGCHVYECMEFAAENISGAPVSYGTKMQAWPVGMRQTRYRYQGMDKNMNTDDDIVTTYLFNSSGQTINGISENGSEDELLGVSSAVYTKNSGTDKTNNRMSGSISSGQAGISLLPNGGFEREGSPDTNGESWLHYLSGGNAARRTDGDNGHLAYSGRAYYNLFGGSTSAVSSIYQDVNVEEGKTYTFSAYVNTGGLMGTAEDGGVYLYARQNDSQQVLGESIMLDHKTGQALDGGWQRLTASFTAPSDAAVRFTVCSYHVYGTIRVDDVQMEKSSAASRFNHVHNGSFEAENKTAGWEISDALVTAVTGTADAQTKKHGRTGLKMNASAPEKNLYAQQTINLYTGADTTFLLSGWGKADSIPDLSEKIEGETDTSLRYWGITLTLNYSDGAKEYFHLPFCDYATNWQYAAMSVTPAKEHAGKTITTADLKLCYKNNANTAYFDSISLIEEPAQTYKYDKEGNLISVKDSGNGEETYEFREGTMDLNKVGTKGSGDYEYVYPETGNKHLPVQIKNDNVVMDITYDADGQTTKTTLGDGSENGSDLYMESTAVYNGGLLRKITDNAGSYVNYGYDSKRRLIKTADAAGNEVWTQYDNTWDRPVSSYQSGFISLANTYADGSLTRITRNGKLAQNGTGVTQDYTFTYDDFGRNTSVSVGGYKVADYHYNGAGLLDHMDYGTADVPQAVTSYSYDELERVKEATYYNNWTNETVRYGYLYASDGNLAGITKNGELLYIYDYDSLGRLIHSSMLENGRAVLYTGHTYDTSDRILSQSWQIGDDAFTESYVYEEKDGTLKQMSSGGDTLAFTYDDLKRFDTRTSEVMKVDYDYRNISSTRTTTQVSQIRYTDKDTGENLMPALGYTYDALGNIETVTSGGSTKNAYTYDAQNQLTAETIYDHKGGTLYASYSYDTYGNIRSITSSLSGFEGESYTMEYGDASWVDRLTKVTYTDKSGNTVDGSFTYDRIGNPLTYFNGRENWNFTWKFGRQLTNASSGSSVISYTYDVDGIRQSKTVNGSTTEFTTLDGKVVRETWGNITTDYFYDNEGKPYKIEISGNAMNCVGYYVLNQQGDVIAILDDAGDVAVTYEYNAWGKVIDETGTGTLNSMHLQSYNHLKYRGYYHDGETGFYYLQSRYYDPSIGRFINADTTISTGQGFIGCNMYTYCLDNPVNYVDYTGYEAVSIRNIFEWWNSTMWGIYIVDGPAPIMDFVYLGGIVVLGIMMDAALPIDEVSNMVIEQPVVDMNIGVQSAYESANERLQKAVAQTEIDIRNDTSHNYWLASYIRFAYGFSTYIPTTPLSFSEAITVIRMGGSVFAASEKHAYKLARAAGYGRIPEWDPPHGELGYYPHYHAKKTHTQRMKGHIFYL